MRGNFLAHGLALLLKKPPSGSQDSQFVVAPILELPSTLPALMIMTKIRKWLSPLNKVFFKLNDRPR